MVGIGGVLKIRVIKGRDLVVRDFFSSDPYVKLYIGQYAVKTKVIKNDLYPTWNEELTLATPDPPLPLKLFVFDWNMFSSDDRMGDAKINLKPLIAAGKLGEGSQNFQDGMEICTIAATDDNDFANDSVIKVKNGEIVQLICINLRNVKKGEVELELKWQPYCP